MDGDETAFYLCLLATIWDYDTQYSIPNNPELIAQLLKISVERWMKLSEKIKKCFLEKNGRFISKRLKVEKAKQDKYRKIQSEKGKKGGRPEKATVKPELNNGKADVKPPNPNHNPIPNPKEDKDSSKEPDKPDPSKHFTAKLPEKTAEEIINLCREIKIEKFNPFQFVQKFHAKVHPLAILDTLQAVKKQGHLIGAIWPYAEKVLKERSKDRNALSSIEETAKINAEILEFFRKARASP